MLAIFQAIRNRLTGENNRQHELTLENCGLARHQIERGRKAVHIIGVEDAEKLTIADMTIFLYAVGLNPTDDLIDAKLRALKLHQQGSINFAQLCHIWHAMLADLADEENILRKAFQFFDKDGNGEISVAELRTTMHELGDLLSEEEIMEFMKVMDVNNDGVIGYGEFLATLKTQAPILEDEEQFFAQDPADGDAERDQ